MNCKLTLTANAGLIVNAGICFTIDALHNIKSNVFPSLDREMTGRVFALLDETPPSAMLVTHEHIDHFSRALTSRAVKRYDKAVLLHPAAIKAGKGRYNGAGYFIRWFPLPHAYVPGFDMIPNYAFLFETEGKTIFTPGDASPTAPETVKLVSGLKPDLAILNFTWVSLRDNRTVLERMNAKNVVFVHLPFPDADPSGYNPATKLAIRNYYPSAHMLSDFMESIELEL